MVDHDNSYKLLFSHAELIFPVRGGLEHYRPRMRYLLIDEGRYSSSELDSLRNLAAALFRLEKSREPADIRMVLEKLIEWLKAPEQTALRRAFTVWFGRVFLPGKAPGEKIPEFHDLQEVRTMLSETVIEWTKKWRQEGRQEVAKRLVTMGFSDEQIREATGLSIEEIRDMKTPRVSEPPPEDFAKPRPKPKS